MTSKSLKAESIIGELKKCGITHIVWLPDSGSRFIYNTLRNQDEIVLVQVCREGESIGIATGLRIGGKNPVVMIQNTGFLESGDAFRGLGLGYPFPMLLLIGYRGWQRAAPVTDTAAIFIKPVLDAWGIKHYLVETDQDVDKISIAYKEAQEAKRPVVVLFGREYQES